MGPGESLETTHTFLLARELWFDFFKSEE